MITVKSLHLLGLVMGLGFGMANIAIMWRLPAAAAEAKPTLMQLQKFNGRVAFAGVILLWITGLWLFYAKYLGVNLGGVFHAKLAFVVALTVLAAYAQWVLLRAGQTGSPPPANTMRMIGHAVPALAATSAVLAVIAFDR
jgi:uncharacterized membrane protein